MSIREEKKLQNPSNFSTTSDAQIGSKSSTADNNTHSSYIMERITRLEGPIAIIEDIHRTHQAKENKEVNTSTPEQHQISKFSSHRLDSNKTLDDAICYVINKRFEVLQQLAE